MHEIIARFPNDNIYDGKLRNGPHMDAELDVKFAGLRQALINIQATYGIIDLEKQALYKEQASDHKARLAYMQVAGKRRPHPSTKSMNVQEHVDTFFSKIYPELAQLCKEQNRPMEQWLMIICAYSHAVSCLVSILSSSTN